MKQRSGIVGSTPVPYMKNGKIKFSTIKELVEKNDKSIEILTAGLTWVKVEKFFKNKFTGKLVKTIQKNGIVETTDNHYLIGKDLKPFLPEEKKEILAFRNIDIPETKTEIKIVQRNRIENEIRRSIKSKKMTKEYTGDVVKFIAKMDDGLDNVLIIRNILFEINLNVDTNTFETFDKMKAAQMSFLAATLGKEFYVNSCFDFGEELYTIYFEDDQYFPNLIETREVEDITVYDIKCEHNNAFVAGVGNLYIT